MSHMMVTHEVEDFDKWHAVFNEVSEMRGEAGEKSARIFRDANNPNLVTGLFEWDNLQNAQEYAQSARLKTAMHDAGVTSKPTVTFLEGV